MSFLLGLLTGGSSLYVWAAIAIAILFLLGVLVKAWNGPKVEQENTKQAKERTERIAAIQRERTERARIRAERRARLGRRAKQIFTGSK